MIFDKSKNKQIKFSGNLFLLSFFFCDPDFSLSYFIFVSLCDSLQSLCLSGFLACFMLCSLSVGILGNDYR